MFLNVRYKSKEESLLQVLDTLEPDILVLAETKVSKNKKFDFKQYEHVKRNGSKGKNGLVCAVKKNTFESICNITYTDEDNILVCKIQYRIEDVVRVIAVYGPQEQDDHDSRVTFYENLSIEVERAIHSGDRLLIIGDLNAKLTTEGEKVVPVRGNGELLFEIINKFQLSVMNFEQTCSGKWTWSRQIQGTVYRSILDYLIVDSQTRNEVIKMVIDEEKISCPFHSVVENGNRRIIYSDHNPIITELSIQQNKLKPEKVTRWIITEKQLCRFRELTEIAFRVDVSSVDATYSSFESTLDKIMSECFKQKVVHQKSTTPLCTPVQQKVLKLITTFSRRGKIQREIAAKHMKRINAHLAEIISRRRKKKVEKTVDTLTFDNHFAPNEFWKLKKILCPKSKMEKSMVVLENGDELHGEEAMKEAYRQEFVHRLQPNQIDEIYTTYEQRNHDLLDLYIKWAKKNVSAPDFCLDEVKQVLSTLSTKKAPGIDGIPNEVLRHAGKAMIEALVSVLNTIKKEFKSPVKWDNVQITTLFKNVGSKRKLVNFRGIFLSSCVSKVCERLILKRAAEPLANISNRQAGARKGKSTNDNVFLLNACIDHARYLNQPAYILFFDFKQCFDKLWLEDCLVSLWDIGIRNEWLPLILSMNQNANISVNTPTGVATAFAVKRIVKQGTVTGSTLCGASTAEFGGDVSGFQIGHVNVKPPIFVDDIAVITHDVLDTIDAHRKAIFFAKRKRLAFSKSKCVILVINGKKKDIDPVLMIDEHVMEKKTNVKYLGDIFNDKGNNKDLIEDRVKKGKGKLMSIIALCVEASLGRYLIQTLLLLYKTMFLPVLIFNCQAWSHLTLDNVNKLQTIQLKFLKQIMSVPQSTSNCFVYLDLGILPVEYEIHTRQLSFLHHILKLENDDPVKQVYIQSLKLQHEQNWANSMKSLVLRYTIFKTDEEIAELSKESWKTLVKQKVMEQAFNSLCKTAHLQSKTNTLHYDNFSTQPYITLLPTVISRHVFRIRSKTVPCKVNHKSKYGGDLSCRTGCTAEESQEHVLNCPNILGFVPEMVPLLFLNDIDLDKDRSRINILSKRLSVVHEFMENIE